MRTTAHVCFFRQFLSFAFMAALSLASLAVLPAAAQMPGAAEGEKPDGSADAVVNLKAYAEYKMGHYDEAKRIWEELAAKGNTTAMINLSNMFGQGNGVTADEKKAFSYTQKAAELGDARAQHDVGLEYEKGKLVPRDIGKAAEWLKKSADQDYGDGQFAYGVLLATGRGKGIEKATAADKADALDYLKKAKANGNDRPAVTRHAKQAEKLKLCASALGRRKQRSVSSELPYRQRSLPFQAKADIPLTANGCPEPSGRFRPRTDIRSIEVHAVRTTCQQASDANFRRLLSYPAGEHCCAFSARPEASAVEQRDQSSLAPESTMPVEPKIAPEVVRNSFSNRGVVCAR